MKKRVIKSTDEGGRHGDVLLRRIERLPDGAVECDTRILAEGEATGHVHQLVGGDVTVYTLNGVLFLAVHQTTELVHAEHKTITIPDGLFEIAREREYDPFADLVRQTMD
jgi:hypothetical protein